MHDSQKKTIKEELEKDLFKYTNSILIGMSNICNYSDRHPRCPISEMKEKTTLPFNIIEKLILELKELKFRKILWPFFYSEPLIDPRLFSVMELIKTNLPKARIQMYTNGFMMNKNLLLDLKKFQIRRIIFSTYNEIDHKRFTDLIIWAESIKFPIALRIAKRYPMDKRMNDKLINCWYERAPIKLDRSCAAPLSYITINEKGEVVICCHDYRAMHVLGNIKDNTLKEILLSDKVIDTYVSLINKERSKFFLCERCTKYR